MHACKESTCPRQEYQLLEDGCGLDERNFREISVEVRVAFVLQKVMREEKVEQNEQAHLSSHERTSPTWISPCCGLSPIL